MCEATAPESPEPSEEHDAIETIEECVQEDAMDTEEHAQPLDTGLWIWLWKKCQSLHRTMQSTVCKAAKATWGNP